MPQDKENAIQEGILMKTAENAELLGDIKSVGIETVSQLEKVQKAIKDIKIPEPPNNKEIQELLNDLIEEVKNPCGISITLTLK